MRKLRKITALIISAAMMITMASCGKEEKVDIRGRNTNNPFTATIERDDDKTTEEGGTGTATTGPTTELTTEQVGDVDPEAEKAFKEFEDEYFKYVITKSYLGYHYSIKDGSKFGIDRPEASW